MKRFIGFALVAFSVVLCYGGMTRIFSYGYGWTEPRALTALVLGAFLFIVGATLALKK